jgi:branched-chain amino acid transport system ATP-binding protein
MLEAKGLMVFYENMLALNNVSVKCEKNQIVGVFGANSAGKSTLMYTLSGIIEDIRKKEEMSGGERISVLGEIQYLGQDITEIKPSRRAKIGIVLCPERRRIFKECTVIENLRIGGYLASTSQADKTLAYIFKIFPALEMLKKRIGGFLSGFSAVVNNRCWPSGARSWRNQNCCCWMNPCWASALWCKRCW